ncbi:hypothetical protein CRG98_033289 [Punica granatum]|uniref:Uncharacterized protein n=1 Tax=Punica granatum TaxID=22663 RepID=A0A2I0IRG5_PUNGR|nr:hypothetical protein CRG98_033289 [Punica granatum]
MPFPPSPLANSDISISMGIELNPTSPAGKIPCFPSFNVIQNSLENALRAHHDDKWNSLDIALRAHPDDKWVPAELSRENFPDSAAILISVLAACKGKAKDPVCLLAAVRRQLAEEDRWWIARFEVKEVGSLWGGREHNRQVYVIAPEEKVLELDLDNSRRTIEGEMEKLRIDRITDKISPHANFQVKRWIVVPISSSPSDLLRSLVRIKSNSRRRLSGSPLREAVAAPFG